MNYWNLHNALDNARFVRVRPHSIYVWHGGNTINIYDREFAECECFTIHGPTLSEIINSIDERIGELV
jgi:hypothetical protein